MKKALFLILTLAVLVTATVVPAFAATKADILTEAAKSPVYKYVKVGIENAAKSIEVTEEQADQIMPYVQHIVSLLDKDYGASAHTYPAEVRQSVMDDIDAICAILDLTAVYTLSENPQHELDQVITIYNADGKAVFSFDGDVKKTGEDSSAAAIAFAVAGAVVLAAGVVVFFVTRKKESAING